jgi:hypothetical protein
MEYKVIRSNHVEGLNDKIKEMIGLGWTPVGSHQVVVTHIQNRFSGLQLKDSVHEVEYSISMLKEEIPVNLVRY